MPAPRSLLVAALAVSIAHGAACSPPKPASTGPSRPHSEWVGEQAQLLDDGIDVGAVPANDAQPARDEASEALIPQRMAASDAVGIYKVVAVSTEPVGDKKRYRLELVLVEPLFRKPSEVALVLKVEPLGLAYGTVRATDTRLIGRRLVVFFRRYAADDGGEPITHYHLSPTTKSVLEAISTQATKAQFE